MNLHTPGEHLLAQRTGTFRRHRLVSRFFHFMAIGTVLIRVDFPNPEQYGESRENNE